MSTFWLLILSVVTRGGQIKYWVFVLQAQCTNHMHLPTALELVNEMRARNIPLNTHTYSSWLNVCVKAGELELALDVFNQV